MPFPSATEALSALSSAVQAMLPPVYTNTKRWCSIYPLKINPSGIGGFTGYSADPAGDIFACKVEARVRIDFAALSEDDLQTAVARTIFAIGAKSRGDLQKIGILKLALTTAGERTLSNTGEVNARQLLEYTILFEYQKLPSEGEGVIGTVPITIQLQ